MLAPGLLDLCCGAGGAGEGYSRAGFRVYGVDCVEQPRYPFPMEVVDAVVFARVYADWIRVTFTVVHASPPCQLWSDLNARHRRDYPNLIGPLREALENIGLPYVIENVEGAPLRDPIVLCGTMFDGLRVLRHRLFESNRPLTAPHHPAHPLVFTHDKRKAHYGQLDQNESFVQVTGGGNCTVANARSAMGIDWMTKDELNEAIPPAYTEHIGRQLL